MIRKQAVSVSAELCICSRSLNLWWFLVPVILRVRPEPFQIFSSFRGLIVLSLQSVTYNKDNLVLSVYQQSDVALLTKPLRTPSMTYAM
jgi:hypothetical protein